MGSSWPPSLGGVAEWFKAPVLKTGAPAYWLVSLCLPWCQFVPFYLGTTRLFDNPRSVLFCSVPTRAEPFGANPVPILTTMFDACSGALLRQRWTRCSADSISRSASANREGSTTAPEATTFSSICSTRVAPMMAEATFGRSARCRSPDKAERLPPLAQAKGGSTEAGLTRIFQRQP